MVAATVAAVAAVGIVRAPIEAGTVRVGTAVIVETVETVETAASGATVVELFSGGFPGSSVRNSRRPVPTNRYSSPSPFRYSWGMVDWASPSVVSRWWWINVREAGVGKHLWWNRDPDSGFDTPLTRL